MTNHSSRHSITALLCALVCVTAAPLWAPRVLSQTSQTSQPESPPEDGAVEAVEGGVLIGTIDDDIDLVESAFIRRLTEEAQANGARALLLELNTFGGRVDAAVAIRDALMELSDSGVATHVFINRRAISAGALISLACDKILMTPGGTIGAATPIQQAPGQEMPESVEEKYLSYFREEMRSTAEAKGRDPDIAEAMVDASKVVEGLSDEGKVLTLSTSKALLVGFADFEAETLDEALEIAGLAELPRRTLERNWSEGLVGFLTSATISSFLFLCMIIFAYLEYQTPGFGIFGGGAILCFLILFFSHYLVNLAGWEELLLFGIGVVLLLLEIFVFPGFGIAGIAGLLCMLASAVLLFQAGDWGEGLTLTNPFTVDAIQRVLLATVLGFVVLLLFMRFLPNGARPGRLILDTTLGRAAGYTSVQVEPTVGGPVIREESVDASVDSLEGAVGEALTPLRPAGRAEVGGRRYEVETQGEFIEKGEPVRFLRRRFGRILVRRVETIEEGEA